MTTTQVAPAPAPAQEAEPQRLDEKANAIHGHLGAYVSEPGPSAAPARSPGPVLEPKWGMTTMLGDVLYLLRLTRRKPGIDF